MRRAWPWAAVVTLLLAALNLRGPFVVVAPTAGVLRDELSISAGQVGVLTSLPVLCFGLLAPLALAITRRRGPDAAVVVCLGGVIAGSMVRSVGGYPLAVVGTIVIGVGITVGNIVLPVLIRRDVPAEAVGLVTGAYVSVMNVGSVAVSVGGAPLAEAAGWRVALLGPAVVAVLVAGLWVVRARAAARVSRSDATSAGESRDAEGSPARAPTGADEGVGPLWRRPIAWLLAAAFCAQSSSYYGTTAWLPSVLHDELGLGSTQAGVASSVFQLFGIVGALGVPLLALRLPGWSLVAVVGLGWAALPVQLLLAPEAYLLGSVVGGIAQGGGLAAVFTVIVRVARTQREGEGLSTLVQGVGYVVAAGAPTLLGVLHDAADSWTPPLLVLLGTTVAFLVLGTTSSFLARRHAAAS